MESEVAHREASNREAINSRSSHRPYIVLILLTSCLSSGSSAEYWVESQVNSQGGSQAYCRIL